MIAPRSPAEIATQRWFAEFGGPNLTYLRPGPGGEFWELHSADGMLLGLFKDRAIAFFTARQRGYEAVSTH
jgi:hypothetical protein